MRSFSELSRLETFDERFEYLKLNGTVANETFGLERYINQKFYQSREWKDVRIRVVARDLGRDLGIEFRDIMGVVQVHHMNPMTPKDLYHPNEEILNPEYLISVSHETHMAIHYGSEPPRPIEPIERRPGDTTPWRK